MRGLFLIAIAACSAVAMPSWAPPRGLRPRQDGCRFRPTSAYVSNFTAFFAADGDENKTSISFNYADPGTSVLTTCVRDASSEPVYPVPGTLARYPCENKLVEFSWVAEDWRGKDQLWLVEASCPPANVTDPQGLRGQEASGRAAFNMTCTQTSRNGTSGAGRECGSSGFSTTFSSLAPRPFQPGRLRL